MVRSYQSEDATEVRSIHERCSDFPLPDFTNPLYVAKEVFVRDGKIIGMGALRLTSEAILIVDLDTPIKTRGLAVENLIHSGIFQCQKLGLDEMHAFLTGVKADSFGRILEKRFGFIECSGNPMTLRL